MQKGEVLRPVYCVPERATGLWNLLSGDAKVETKGGAVDLNAGITCILPDEGQPQTLYLCNRHGIFKSTDGGKSCRLVYRNEVRES